MEKVKYYIIELPTDTRFLKIQVDLSLIHAHFPWSNSCLTRIDSCQAGVSLLGKCRYLGSFVSLTCKAVLIMEFHSFYMKWVAHQDSIELIKTSENRQCIFVCMRPPSRLKWAALQIKSWCNCIKNKMFKNLKS